MKALFKEISMSTSKRLELLDITEEVLSFVKECKVESGICIVNSPHTTSAIIVNENESGLKEDILRKIREEFPRGEGWHHDLVDDNADAHLAAVFLGHSKTLLLRDGKIVRGTWQTIFFLELDGPRSRSVQFEVMGV